MSSLTASPFTSSLVAGGLAGCASKTCVAPLSRLVALRQVQSVRPMHSGLTVWEMVRSIIEKEGVSAFWRGNSATLLHRAVQSGLAFSVIAALDRVNWPRPRGEVGGTRAFSSRLAVSSIAASCSISVTHPLDVVKTRLITECGQNGSRYYQSTGQACVQILRDEGMSGFYRGFSMSLISAVPTIALNFAIFDTLRPIICRQEPAAKIEVACTGSCSAAMASSITFPLDLLKKQLQLNGSHSLQLQLDGSACAKQQPSTPIFVGSAIDAARSIKRNAGWRGFYRGLTLEIAKVAPGGAILFVSNEYFLALLRRP